MADTGIENLGLGTLLRRLLAVLDGDVQRVYDSLDVPFRPRFYPIARHLKAHGPTGVGALAEHAGVSQPAVTQTIAEMRAAGLVETVNGKDRRARLVGLTEEGTALIERLEPVWRSIHRAGAALDGELAVPLGAILTSTLDRLERHPFHDRIREQLEK